MWLALSAHRWHDIGWLVFGMFLGVCVGIFIVGLMQASSRE